jgi:hypothetical protein
MVIPAEFFKAEYGAASDAFGVRAQATKSIHRERLLRKKRWPPPALLGVGLHAEPPLLAAGASQQTAAIALAHTLQSVPASNKSGATQPKLQTQNKTVTTIRLARASVGPATAQKREVDATTASKFAGM